MGSTPIDGTNFMNQRKTPKSVKKGEPGYEEYKAFMTAYMLTRYHTIRQQMVDYLGGKCAHCTDTVDVLLVDKQTPHTIRTEETKLSAVNSVGRVFGFYPSGRQFESDTAHSFIWG